MRRIMFFRVAGRDVYLPRLVGAFILLAALLMFIQASAKMFDSWDNLKEVENCLAVARTEPEFFPTCQQNAKASLDLYVRLGQDNLTARQFFGALLVPIAMLLFWLAVLFVGWIFYKTGEVVVPIEESWHDFPEKNPDKKRKK